MTTDTPRVPGPVDLDLLADYGCGVLEPAEVDRVDRLIDSDPAWAAAHRSLRDADPLVAAELADLGGTPATMPADVLARILHEVGDGSGTGPTVRDLDAARRRRHKVAAWSLSAAAAVVVVALAGIIGIGRLTSGGQPSADHAAAPASKTSSSPPSVDLAPNGVPGSGHTDAKSAPRPGVRVAVSGTDYSPATLPDAVDATAAPGLDPAARQRVPEELQRLLAPAALDACLRTVSAEHPGVPQLVDYALFKGRPALVVVVRTGSATGTVVAGPACGTDGADIRYQTGQ